MLCFLYIFDTLNYSVAIRMQDIVTRETRICRYKNWMRKYYEVIVMSMKKQNVPAAEYIKWSESTCELRCILLNASYNSTLNTSDSHLHRLKLK